MLPLLLLIESPPLPGIVPALDVIKDIRSRLGSRLVLPPIDPLPFEHAEETFRCSVIRTTAYHAHTTGHLVGRQELLVFRRGKLTPPIGMENDRGTGGPLPDRHEDSLDDQLAILPCTHGPAHHEPGIQIEDDTQVQLVFGGPHIGNIGDPFDMGRGGGEVSRQMVAGSSRRCP